MVIQPFYKNSKLTNENRTRRNVQLGRNIMWRLWLLSGFTLASYYYVSTTTFLLELAAGLFPFVVNITGGGGRVNEDSNKSESKMAGNVDLSWHAPISSGINNLTSAINGTGTYGFIFNSSQLPDGTPYGIAIPFAFFFSFFPLEKRLNTHLLNRDI